MNLSRASGKYGRGGINKVGRKRVIFLSNIPYCLEDATSGLLKKIIETKYVYFIQSTSEKRISYNNVSFLNLTYSENNRVV